MIMKKQTLHPFQRVLQLFSNRKIGIIAIAILMISYGLMKPVDLRNSTLKQTGITPQNETEGRAILQKMATVHGIKQYQKHQTQTLYFTNTWQSLAGAVYRPWKENGQEIEMTCTIGEHLIAETKFLSGKNKNQIWGIDEKGAYTKSYEEGQPNYAKNSTVELWLPSFQFLFDIPFRVEYLPIVASLGEDKIGDQRYLKVFATWFDIHPSNGSDQIVYWINADTYQLDKLHYTCRGSGFGFFSATIHYQDYLKKDGILVAQSANITFGGPKEKYFGELIDLHQIEMLQPKDEFAARHLF